MAPWSIANPCLVDLLSQAYQDIHLKHAKQTVNPGTLLSAGMSVNSQKTMARLCVRAPGSYLDYKDSGFDSP